MIYYLEMTAQQITSFLIESGMSQEDYLVLLVLLAMINKDRETSALTPEGSRKKKGGSNMDYSQKTRAKIARSATENENTRPARHFSHF